ncbi:unnamed protein product [Sympodiomycopsis kandeliae]
MSSVARSVPSAHQKHLKGNRRQPRPPSLQFPSVLRSPNSGNKDHNSILISSYLSLFSLLIYTPSKNGSFSV